MICLVGVGEGYDCLTDWWSVGCILFEIVVGIPPFCGETPQEVFAKIMNYPEELKELKTIPEVELSSVCWDLLDHIFCPFTERIGRNGMKEILYHPFFQDIDWKDTKMPFVPVLSSDADLKYFDNHEMMPSEETEDPTMSPSDPANHSDIKGFTFQRDQFMRTSINRLSGILLIVFWLLNLFFFDLDIIEGGIFK